MNQIEETTEENKKVFIVHGRDNALRDEVKAFLEEEGWQPIVLAEQASLGRTIIEKIEDYASVRFAVVLYTGCDVGMLKGKSTLNPRARQNVVLEHGFFMGRLGRTRVFAIKEDGVETPNDIAGVVYIPKEGDWKSDLSTEINAALQQANSVVAHNEDSRPTSQPSTNNDLLGLQILQAERPTAARQMEQYSNKIPQRGSEKDTICGKLEEIMSRLMLLFDCDGRDSRTDVAIRETYDLLKEMQPHLAFFMPWANAAYRWFDRVERYISNPQEREECKKSLLIDLSAQDLCILWLCHLAEGKTHDNKDVAYLPLSDFAPYLTAFAKWVTASEKKKEVAIRIISEKLRAMHLYMTAPIAHRQKYWHELADNYHESVYKMADEVDAFWC